jgi:hypothetical protein
MTSPEQADAIEAMKAAVEALTWHHENPNKDAPTDIPEKRDARAIRRLKAAIDRLAAVALHPQPPDVHLAQAQGAPAVQRSSEDEADAIDAAKYRALNTPEIAEFLVAIEREALHQRERWGVESDGGKTDADWFWLIGYLAGKAIRPDGSTEKRLHHIITTAAACMNWHAARVGTYTAMRPGIAPPTQAKEHGNVER